ncbi:MAG: M28 family peptidase, partial [Bacteroidota bacterium]|nr:M28 family peptidase [Bacteroidota bacterium]
MSKIICFLLTIILSYSVDGQTKKYADHIVYPDTGAKKTEDSAVLISKTIQAELMREYVYYLSSDSCEGRELGSKGIDRAAQYLSSKFDSYGIQKIGDSGGYFQKVGFRWVSWKKMSLDINGSIYRHLWDYVSMPADNKDLLIKASEIVFLGYGIDDPKYSDYKNADVKNKIILIYKGEPKNSKGRYFISGNSSPSDWSSQLSKKIKAAEKHGVKLVLLIEDKLKELVDANRQYILSPFVQLDGQYKKEEEILTNLIHISAGITSGIMGKSQKKVIQLRNKINKTGKAQKLSLKTTILIDQTKEINSVQGNNIMAFIEGSDKKDEIVIITAHYDHIGKRGNDVFNGADDNASGTAAVSLMAKAFQDAKNKGMGPRRSV